MTTPFLSVIIPALNEEHFLPELLASLSHQTVRNFEVIVVDGHSKDKTVEKAKEFASKLPHLIVCVADHANLPYQRNVGADTAKGEWLIFLDADNRMLPYALERMEAFIREKHPDLFSSWTRPDSDATNDTLFALFGNAVLEGSIVAKRPFSPGPFTAVSKSVFAKVGGYTSGLKWGEDVDFSCKVQRAGYSLSIVREVLYTWSLRRLRREGKLKFIQQSAKAAFYWLLTNKAFTQGYEMGGHLYKTKKKVNTPVIKKLTRTIQKLMKEVFE